MEALPFIICLTVICSCFEFGYTVTLQRKRENNANLLRYRRAIGQCGDPGNVQCCPGTDGSCRAIGGCYCDEYCMQVNDCCDDYITTCQSGPCNTYSIIANQSKRSSDYVTDALNDDFISDQNLTAGWFIINSPNGANMPTEPPGYLHCGTEYPIWLNGTLPSVEDGNVTRDGCVQTSNDICVESVDIGIVNCSEGFLAYYLQSTSPNTAYCFGNGPVLCYNGLSSETGYYPGCSSSFPSEVEHPVVQAILTEGETINLPFPNPGPSLHSVFWCKFNDIANSNYVYDVNWYINGENVTVFKNKLFSQINDTFMYSSYWKEKYKMNMEVSCSVRLRFSINSLPSPFFTSHVFKAGLYPEKYEYTVIEKESINITFFPTVPVACFASNPDIRSTCDQNFYIQVPTRNSNNHQTTCTNNIVNRDIVFQTKFCGLSVNSLTWEQPKNLTVFGFVDGKYNSQDRSTFINITATSSESHNDMWVGIGIPLIKASTADLIFEKYINWRFYFNVITSEHLVS